MKGFSKFIRDCFTGVDNQTWDFMRVGIAAGSTGILAGMGVIIAAGIKAVIHGDLDYSAFATGLATAGGGFVAVIAGGGLGLFAKRSTEPQAKVTQISDDGDGTTTVTEAKS